MKIHQHEYDLSIVIVSHDTCDLLIKCLDSIYRYSEDLRIQIIISDNASSDDTLPTITNGYESVEIIVNPKNLGFGKANNRAIRFCKADLILFLNPDVFLVEPVLKRMAGFLVENEDVGAVGCRLMNPDGSLQKSYYHAFPTLFNRFSDAMCIEKLLEKSKCSPTTIDCATRVAGITGACMLIRKDLINRLGGFDERFFMYCEDVDLCYRIKKSGYSVYYLGYLKMIHYEGAATKSTKPSYFTKVLTRDSVYKYFSKHHSALEGFLYRLIMIGAASVRLLVLFSFRPMKRIMGIQTDIDYHSATIRYLKVVSWGLGFEKWTRTLG